MEKKVFSKLLFFFSEKKDVTVIDVRDMDQDVVEVHSSRFYHKNDGLVRYIYASLFLFKITSCKVTSHWRQNTELSATNGLKLFAASLKNPLVQRIIHSINKKCFATCYRCHDINGLPIRGLPFLRNDTECSKKMFFVLRLIISRVIRHCKFYRKAHALFWKKFSDMFFSN